MTLISVTSQIVRIIILDSSQKFPIILIIQSAPYVGSWWGEGPAQFFTGREP